MRKPKDIYAGLRKLRKMLEYIETDLVRYLDDPAEFQSEYFEDVLDATKQAINLAEYVKNELEKGA